MPEYEETRIAGDIIRRRKIVAPKVCFKTYGGMHEFEITPGNHTYPSLLDTMVQQGMVDANDFRDARSLIIDGKEFVLPLTIPFRYGSRYTIEPQRHEGAARVRLLHGFEMSSYLVPQGEYRLPTLFTSLRERPWIRSYLIDLLDKTAQEDKRLYLRVDDNSITLRNFNQTISLDQVLLYEKGRCYDLATVQQIERR
jgi:hypothetical protein